MSYYNKHRNFKNLDLRMMWLDRRMRLKEKDTWIDTETENPKDEEQE